MKQLLTEQAAWLAPARARLLRRVAIAHRQRVLDLGAGPGAVTPELVRRSGGLVVALDVDLDALQTNGDAVLGSDCAMGAECGNGESVGKCGVDRNLIAITMVVLPTGGAELVEHPVSVVHCMEYHGSAHGPCMRHGDVAAVGTLLHGTAIKGR